MFGPTYLPERYDSNVYLFINLHNHIISTAITPYLPH